MTKSTPPTPPVGARHSRGWSPGATRSPHRPRLRRCPVSYWKAVADAKLPQPPIGELLQLRVDDVENGRITFSCTPDASMYNPLGMVHGGAVCTLLDTVTGCALHTTLPEGVGYTSVEIKVNYLKAVTMTSGPLIAVGTVVKAGSRIGFTEGKVTDASGALVATATSTLLVFDLRSDAKH